MILLLIFVFNENSLMLKTILINNTKIICISNLVLSLLRFKMLNQMKNIHTKIYIQCYRFSYLQFI